MTTPKTTLVEASDLEAGLLEAVNEEQPLILDARRLSHDVLLSNLTTLAKVIQENHVHYIWLPKTKTTDFHEIKGRLKNHLRLQFSTCPSKMATIDTLLLKLIRIGNDTKPEAAMEAAKRLQTFAEAVGDLKSLTDLHPGLPHLLMKSCRNNAKDQSNGPSNVDDVTEVDNSLSLKRKAEDDKRPTRKILKTVERFHNQQDLNCLVKKCYMCKMSNTSSSTIIYTKPTICSKCDELNKAMKEAKADLDEMYAVVTGARIKIGFEAALRLLRNGCFVVATTRFPADAIERYAKESDFAEFKDRLRICHLDLEDLGSINKFLDYLKSNVPHLDIFINNAAQTIHRPQEYYARLKSKEAVFLQQENLQELNMIGCMPDAHSTNGNKYLELKNDNNAITDMFPEDKLDHHGEQLDLRPRNSWTYGLGEVPIGELLQVLTINAVGPFILASRLKSLILKSPRPRKFVVNVSAMEGQFSRSSKGHRHPHTNMAKAALNMLVSINLQFKMNQSVLISIFRRGHLASSSGWTTSS